MKIHREGKIIIPPSLLVIAVLAIISFFLLNDYLIVYFIYGALVVLTGLVFWFFREPDINIAITDNGILSVADGKVVIIKPVYEKEYFKDERIQVSVFMSPLNVHINRVPIKSEIVYQNHVSGLKLPAFLPKSSEKNEHCSTVFKLDNGEEVLARQIAGTLARRIVTYKKPGAKVNQNDHLGFIRFGSRVDLFLPPSYKIEVKLEEKVTGGKTVIATFDK